MRGRIQGAAPHFHIERLFENDNDAWRRFAPDLPEDAASVLEYHFGFWADPRQLPPPLPWRTWLIMAGRGFGKTRAGAEWVRAQAMAGDADTRIALVAPTLHDARTVMVEGMSGVLACSPPGERPGWEPTVGRLVWTNGAQAQVFSSEVPDRLRGPQHHFAWCDELAAWHAPQACWDLLQMGLRLGDDPRAAVTTTPRALPMLRAMIDDPGTTLTRGAMTDNRYLPESFRAHMIARHEGTRLARQELEGELIEEVEGALWTRDLLDACRTTAHPELRRVVIGVDPPASATGDACGIVVVGIDGDGVGHVIEDASVERCSPEVWAAAVARAADRHGADRVIAEANNGGAMVESVLRAADAGLPIALVHASRGKVARAEPILLLYARGQVRHCGVFRDLEDELCGLVTGGGYAGPGRSPDRADACVWALTDLLLRRRGKEPGVRVV